MEMQRGRVGFMEDLRFHWRLAKLVPLLLWRSAERWVTLPLVILGVTGLVSPAGARWLSGLWFGAPFWVGLGLLVAIFLYYLMKANFTTFNKIERDRDSARMAQLAAEQERDREREAREDLERRIEAPPGILAEGSGHSVRGMTVRNAPGSGIVLRGHGSTAEGGIVDYTQPPQTKETPPDEPSH